MFIHSDKKGVHLKKNTCKYCRMCLVSISYFIKRGGGKQKVIFNDQGGRGGQPKSDIINEQPLSCMRASLRAELSIPCIEISAL